MDNMEERQVEELKEMKNNISTYFSSMFSKSFHNSSCLSSILYISYHISTYFSSIFSKSFHNSTYLSSILSLSFQYSTFLSSVFSNGRKASWIVKRYGKYERKLSWIMKK
jgi:hypothetical protein